MRKHKLITDTRRRILEAAIDEFAHYGLAGARVDRIAGQADVNKAMIYYHFSSKEKLYGAIIEYVIDQIIRVVRSDIAPETDFRTVLLALAKQYNRFLGKDRRMASLFLHDMARGGGLVREAFRNTIEHQKLPDMLRAMLEAGIQSGKYTSVDVKQALISFFGMNMFYLMMSPIVNEVWEIDDAQDFLERRPEAVVDLFLHGITAR